jgi:hypothetical protein
LDKIDGGRKVFLMRKNVNVVSLFSVKIGSSYTKKAKKYAFVQTDFPALLATTSEYNYIVKVTNPTYNWTDAVNYVQCDQVLPDVVFSIGGVDYTVPGETYKVWI